MNRQVLLIISILGWMIIGSGYPILLQAQAPQSFSYQAIVRDADGEPLADQQVSLRISLHQGSETGSVVYSETHDPVTSPLGLVNLGIGTGTVISGTFTDIDWPTGQYFLELEIDPAGGSAYVPLGTTQLVSVPYALFSEQTAQAYTAGAGIDITNDVITNTIPDQLVNLSGGTGIGVSGAYPNFTIYNTSSDQVVSLSPGTGISVTGAYPDFTVMNTAPNASHTGDATGSEALTVTGIQGRPVSSAAPTSDQVLQWNGAQWNPATLAAASPGWSLTGNSGTDPAENFLGTTDNQPLKFRVNNLPAGEMNPLNYNTFFGTQAGASSTGGANTAFGTRSLFTNSTGYNNTATGYQALYFTSTGHDNTATGCFALSNNSEGYYNTAFGSYALSLNQTGCDNTAVGRDAMKLNEGGNGNTAVGSLALGINLYGNENSAMGHSALMNNTTGGGNTAAGYQSLLLNTEGHQNTAVGLRALFNNKLNSRSTAIGTGAMYNADNNQVSAARETFNTAIGYEALKGSYTAGNNTGRWNTAVGDQSMLNNSSGDHNTALGTSSLLSNTTGHSNTAIGDQALMNNLSGYGIVAVGKDALFKNTDRNSLVAVGDSTLYNNGQGASEWFHSLDNTAVGYKALYKNTTGYLNTAIGSLALHFNTTGHQNTASGYMALLQNTTGYRNTASGESALGANTEGYLNTAVGFNALEYNQTGDENTAIGADALMYNTTGDQNTASGYMALYLNTGGNYNTATGGSALYNNSSGGYNTAVGHGALFGADDYYLTGLGHNANVSSADIYNSSVIGDAAIVNANAKIRIGDASMTVIEGQVEWSWPSDGRFKQNVSEDVRGLAFIRLLRPIVYNFDTRKYTEFLTRNMPDSLRTEYLSAKDFSASTAVRHSGFVAQEVVEAAAACGYNFSGVHVPVNDQDNYSIAYGQFVVPLVKAVQEQQAMIEEQRSMIEALQKKVAELAAEVGETR